MVTWSKEAFNEKIKGELETTRRIEGTKNNNYSYFLIFLKGQLVPLRILTPL